MTAPPEGSPGVDILIAEDDALMRENLRTLLEMEGYHCEETADGRTALEMARRSPPRCAILDLVMPGMDGFTVARRLRADPRTCHIHIHCLTGIADAASREEAEKAGFESYMTKPVDPSQLLRIVRGEATEPETVLEESGLSLDEARDLLDRWENAGYRELEAHYKEGQGFIVRGIRPAS